MSVFISPILSLILLIWILSLYLLVNLSKCLSILLFFSRNQFFISLILCVLFCLFLFYYQTCLIIYCSLFLWDFISHFFLSRALMSALKLLIWNLFNFFYVGNWCYAFSSTTLSFHPIGLDILCFQFHSILNIVNFLLNLYLDQLSLRSKLLRFNELVNILLFLFLVFSINQWCYLNVLIII